MKGDVRGALWDAAKEKKRKKESGCLRNEQLSVGPIEISSISVGPIEQLSVDPIEQHYVGPIGQLSVGPELCGEPWASCHHLDIFSSKTRLSGEPCALPRVTITLLSPSIPHSEG